MNTPPVYWGRINGWSVLASVGGISVACIGGLIAGSLWFGETNSKLDNAVNKPELAEALRPINAKLDMQTRDNAATADAFKEIRESIAPVAATTMRVSQIENSVGQITATIEQKDKATNERIDRVVDSIGGKLDKAITALNELNVMVRVQGAQIEDLRKRVDSSGNHPQKLIWRTGVIRPDRPVPPTRRPE